MNLDAKFDSVMQAIISQYSNEIEIRNELVHIYNGNRTYSLGNNETFDSDDIRRIMIQTSNDYFLNEVSGKVGILKEFTFDNVENFSEVSALLNDIGKKKGLAEIRNIVNSNVKVINLLIDGLMDVYYYRKNYFVRDESEAELSRQLEDKREQDFQMEVEMRQKLAEISTINRQKSIERLALLDLALEKTQEKGTNGHEGMEQRPYTNQEMVFLLNELTRGNYKSITNTPISEPNIPLRTELFKYSREEILAEIVKNAIRLTSLSKTEKGLLTLYNYDITVNEINMLRSFIDNTNINKDNIDYIKKEIDPNVWGVLLKSFIYSRKDPYIKGEILNATMSDKYAALRIEELDKVGGISLENENDYSK